jgi:ABC-2 type transport system permease protein
MKIYLALTIASLKMYFRNRQALFWALFFPLLIMIIFGIMNFDGYNSPDVGIYDAADNEASRALIQALQGSQEQELLNVTTDSLNELHHELEFGSSRAVIEIPANYGVPGQFAEIKVTYDERFQQERAVVSTILGQVTDAFDHPRAGN